MQFTDLQARATLLASLEGWSDASPAPNWANLVNQAWYQYSWDAECIVSSTTFNTVSGTALYALTGQWKRLMDVIYDSGGANLPLLHSSEDYERYYRADWRVQPSGIPTRYTFSPFNSITLVVPPNATGKVVSVRGIVQGTAFVNATDVPPVPDVLQEAICLYAAYLQGKAYAQGEAMARLKDFEEKYQQYVQDGLRYSNFETQGD